MCTGMTFFSSKKSHINWTLRLHMTVPILYKFNYTCAHLHVESYSVLQCVAVCCSVLQCVAVCCSVLQCVTVCCSVCT